MKISASLRSRLVSVILGPRVRRLRRALAESRRNLLRRPHVVSAFLQLDDPYSYLLAYYLPKLSDSYDIELKLYLSEAQGEGYKPEPKMLAEYAVDDCARLARELGIPFLDKGATPPVEHRLPLLASIATARDNFDDELLQSLAVYWRGDAEGAARRDSGNESAADQLVRESAGIQARLGHYNSATLHYAGEWYWGVDRLHYLLERLDDLGISRGDARDPVLASLQQAPQVTLPVTPPAAAADLPPLELFHSFRSPYSYLSLARTREIADAFGLRLELRPVLPMVMRGMQVPMKKLMYIVKDAAREAERRNAPFGRLADPVGSGIERCMAVFDYAESENRGMDFLMNAGRAIFAERTDLASDAGMRKVADATGLFWPDVIEAMKREDWRTVVEANRRSMTASGSWGVPTLRLGDFVAWGQDRDWLLVRHIEELCDTGDGILV